MIPLKRALTSTIGRKIVMSLSGISLVLFVIVHLAGNLTLLVGPDAFNTYANNFTALGAALYVIELGLLAVIVFHIAFGIIVSLRNRQSRGTGYQQGIKTKGGPSNLNASSRYMFWSGLALGAFIIGHVIHFRGQKFFYDVTTTIGESDVLVLDMYQMVATAFTNPIIVILYVAGAVLLGVHLRHGFWSAFQSLGAMKPEWSKGIYGLGFLIALLLAVGFVGIPVFLFVLQMGA